MYYTSLSNCWTASPLFSSFFVSYSKSAKKSMPITGNRRRTILWTISLLMLFAMMTGCVTTSYEGAAALVERHPKGFRDAVRASSESKEFVRDSLKTINALEAQLESR